MTTLKTAAKETKLHVNTAITQLPYDKCSL